MIARNSSKRRILMPKYSVKLEGRGFLTQYEDEQAPEPTGFYAVRFIEAPDPQTAQAVILEAFTQEITDKLAFQESSTVKVVEVLDVASFGDFNIPEGSRYPGTRLLFFQESGTKFWLAAWRRRFLSWFEPRP